MKPIGHNKTNAVVLNICSRAKAKTKVKHSHMQNRLGQNCHYAYTLKLLPIYKERFVHIECMRAKVFNWKRKEKLKFTRNECYAALKNHIFIIMLHNISSFLRRYGTVGLVMMTRKVRCTISNTESYE